MSALLVFIAILLSFVDKSGERKLSKSKKTKTIPILSVENEPISIDT